MKKTKNFFKHITFTTLILISILVIISVKSAFGHSIAINEEASGEINKLIKIVLDSEYETMKNWETIEYDHLMGDSKLLQLLNIKNAFQAKWYEKVNLKINDYESELSIIDIKKNKEGNYIVDALYSVKFRTMPDSDMLSQSNNEPHKFEIKEKDGELTIVKMIDLTDEGEESVIRSDVNYSEYLNSGINYYENALKNIDEQVEKLREETSEDF